MAQVQTVRGPIDSSQLGTTLMHEHVFVLDTEILQNYPEEWGSEEQRIADSRQKSTSSSLPGSIRITKCRYTFISAGRARCLAVRS
jgi:predicted metal-dependent phosphotriesterase family hydrolase